MTRLLYADFHQDVTAVFAQPFLLSTTVDDRLRRHVPDFLVLRGKDVPLVVDVKPRHLLTRPKVNFALGWAREVVLSRGWDFDVWCEPPEAELANLRFLAGYRRDWLFSEDLLAEIREADLYGASLREAFRAFPHHPEWRVRTAVLRLLWCQHFVTDLSVPLSEPHELRQGPAAVTGSGRHDLPPPVEERERNLDVPKDDVTVQRRESHAGGLVNEAAVRVGVGTRLKYDGEVVTVGGGDGRLCGWQRGPGARRVGPPVPVIAAGGTRFRSGGSHPGRTRSLVRRSDRDGLHRPGPAHG
ncbi:TnsA-like heteromeric transposase endonuclease subunit [Streptomyces sp. NPDC005336]|uniref:TnsA-like heteromeric transposase endonuclease subunit n=1 Tax=Streptomyces sp. NPDC005336 TaxID=3157035 RepID=UPI0033B99460